MFLINFLLVLEYLILIILIISLFIFIINAVYFLLLSCISS